MSIMIATASPNPSCCIGGIEPSRKPLNVAAMISPAAVTIRPVFASPCTTAPVFERVASHASRMRVIRNTS